MELLKIENLKTYFKTTGGDVRAVDDVSFTLDYGETIGLVGESGCGKSTTALSIIKLLPREGSIESGKIIFEGENLVDISDKELRGKRWKDVSIIFQGAMNSLNPVMRIGDQIAEVIMLHENVSHGEAVTKARELFESVEMEPDRINSYPHEFSGGMKQRAMIAMALACSPKLIIGDEPTTALDVMVQAQILDLLEKLRKERRMGMILITHDLSILGETCDKIAVMYAGKIVERGTTEDIIEHPGHPYTIKLLQAFPDIYGDRNMPEAIPGIPPNLINPPSGCRFHPRCSKAFEKCRLAEPEMIKIEGEHFAACHLKGAE